MITWQHFKEKPEMEMVTAVPGQLDAVISIDNAFLQEILNRDKALCISAAQESVFLMIGEGFTIGFKIISTHIEIPSAMITGPIEYCVPVLNFITDVAEQTGTPIYIDYDMVDRSKQAGLYDYFIGAGFESWNAEKGTGREGILYAPEICKK